MEKIPSLFEKEARDHVHLAIDKIRPGFEWVLNGQGLALEKIDGVNVRIISGKLYRRERPDGIKEYTQASYTVCSYMNAEDEPLLKAFTNLPVTDREDAIYEAVGPGIMGNHYNLDEPQLIKILPRPDSNLIIPEYKLNFKRTFAGIREFLATYRMEGIVFKHYDGPICKVKRAEFGLPWPPLK